MTMGQVLSWGMVVMQAAACVAYAWGGDWRRALYWFGAVILTTAVTL